jgi:hypothetical protein
MGFGQGWWIGTDTHGPGSLSGSARCARELLDISIFNAVATRSRLRQKFHFITVANIASTRASWSRPERGEHVIVAERA